MVPAGHIQGRAARARGGPIELIAHMVTRPCAAQQLQKGTRLPRRPHPTQVPGRGDWQQRAAGRDGAGLHRRVQRDARAGCHRGEGALGAPKARRQPLLVAGCQAHGPLRRPLDWRASRFAHLTSKLLRATRPQGLPPLVAAAAQEPEDHIKAAAAWALGQLGRHTPDHAKAVADTGAPLAACALLASGRRARCGGPAQARFAAAACGPRANGCRPAVTFAQACWLL